MLNSIEGLTSPDVEDKGVWIQSQVWSEWCVVRTSPLIPKQLLNPAVLPISRWQETDILLPLCVWWQMDQATKICRSKTFICFIWNELYWCSHHIVLKRNERERERNEDHHNKTLHNYEREEKQPINCMKMQNIVNAHFKTISRFIFRCENPVFISDTREFGKAQIWGWVFTFSWNWLLLCDS